MDAEPTAAVETPQDETQAKTAALCADLTLQLEAQGWSGVNIRPLRRFIQVSATDPKGASHGGAREDGKSLVDYLLSIGATIRIETPRVQTSEPPAVDVRAAVAQLAETINPPPEPKPKAEEAIPVPLARIVPPNLDLLAQKRWAAQRWLELNARLQDMAKLPPDKRPLPDLTKAEEGELELLNRWVGWFT